MTITRQIEATLRETIRALSVLDSERLQSLEKRMMLLGKSGSIAEPMTSLLEAKKALKRLLEQTEDNLSILYRLHGGNGTDSWAR
jgi:hypothetical protein